MLITSAEELVGVYYFRIPPGFNVDYGIIQFNADGSFQYGNMYDAESQSVKPKAFGTWWLEESIFHIIDENSGTATSGWACEPGIEGTYEVFVISDDQIEFKKVRDQCNKDNKLNLPSRWSHIGRAWNVGIPPE